MKTLVAFLLGLIIGGMGMLFLPDPRRDELNSEIRAQTGALQEQVRQFGQQLKNIPLPTSGAGSPTPAATTSPTPSPAR